MLIYSVPRTPIIAMLHNSGANRWHPILFLEAPLPGDDPDKPVRHKSKGHHTAGFATHAEALAEVESMRERLKQHFGSEVRTCLEKDFPWDGDGVPAMVVFFAETERGLKAAF